MLSIEIVSCEPSGVSSMMRDKRTIPVLLDLQPLTVSFDRSRIIADALVRLLPTVEESDSELLTGEHRESFNRLLSARLPVDYLSGALVAPEYLVSILQALSRIGDSSSLPAVERLANSPGSSKVKDAARACLRLLRRRSAELGDALLRPSERLHAEQELV